MSLDSRDGGKRSFGRRIGHSVSSEKGTYDITSNLTEIPTEAPTYTLSLAPPNISIDRSRPTTIFGPPSLITNEDTHVIVVSILIGLIVTLCGVLVALAVPLMRDIIREHMPLNHRRLKRRYETVDGWLITKAVVENDDSMCSAVSATINDGSHDAECMICMEEFAIGDEVSWSPSEDCNHVFHKNCIREWLISHVGCPYCRTCMLPVDGVDRVDSATLREMGILRKNRLKSTFYCLSHGLVMNNKKTRQEPCSPTKEKAESAEVKENNSSFETCSCSITTDSDSENIEKDISVKSCLDNKACDQEAQIELRDLEAGDCIDQSYIINNAEVYTPHIISTKEASQSPETKVKHSSADSCASTASKDTTGETQEIDSLMEPSTPNKGWCQGTQIDEVDMEIGEVNK